MKRIWCGLVKMTEVFGMHFVAAIVAVAALLIWAVMHVHGPLAAVAGLICVLLAVRAHDFADDEEPSEVNAAYDLDDVRRLERAMRRRFPRLDVRVFGYSYPVVMFRPRFTAGAARQTPISLYGVNIYDHDAVGTTILLAAYEGLR